MFYPKVIEKHFDADGKEIDLVDNTQPIASTSNIPLNREEHNAYFTTPESSTSDIIPETNSKLVDKGKEIDTSNFSESEVNRRIMQQVTGDTIIKFNDESNLLLSRINTYIDKHDNDTLPNNKFTEYMYGALKVKLVTLSLTNSKYYQE
jgi:hypothetical protein